MQLPLSDFHELVEDSLGRSSLNTRIPKRVAMAVGWLERNFTFQYMRTWRQLTALTTATYPYIISLHDISLKGIELMRIRRVNEDDPTEYLFDRPMRKVFPGDRETRGTGIPESYWINGRSSIILNSIPDEDTTFECHLQEFTKWQYDQDNFTHWLLDNATQLLMCRTMMMMATGPARDVGLYQAWKADFDLEISSFKVSEEEIQSGDFVQVWEPPEYTERDNSLRSA